MKSINNNNNKYFISRSHGDVITDNGLQVGTKIQINNNTSTPYFDSVDSMTGLNLSNMDLIMFVGCKTGMGGSNGANLIKKAVNLGAGTAVGFQNTISCGLDNQWVESFMSRIKADYTISQTCSYLDSISPFAGTSLVSNVISGDGNLSLN